MNYWLNLFTGETWEEFLSAGGNVSGFSERKRKVATKIKAGDIFLCYMTGIMRWVGAYRFVGLSESTEEIWSSKIFPVRFDVESIVTLEPSTGVPLDQFEGQLDWYKGPEDRGKFKGFLRGSPNRFKRKTDGDLILEALKKAEQNPVERSFDEKKLYRKTYQTKLRRGKKTVTTHVTIPENDEPGTPVDRASKDDNEEIRIHTRIQHNLLTLGSEMGLDLWVARNDRKDQCDGVSLREIEGNVDRLPSQFSEVVTRTVELIDVLWLKGNTIIAAFEVESSTSVYSGLLRMSDLVALHPNIDIKLFIVAPSERREKVRREILRPTFNQLAKPLHKICGYIPFEGLIEKVKGIRKLGVASSLNPDFLEKTAEYFEK